MRDGGYVNGWQFGKTSIKNILQKLTNAEIDWIECGFLKDQPYEMDKTLFQTPMQVEDMIPSTKKKSQYVMMINFGEYPIEKLPIYSGGTVQGIRVVFHKKDMAAALEYCKLVQAKGYQLFIQPMVTIKYEDKELIELIAGVNEIKPYAFYIVDSFGVMRKKDLLRMVYLIDHTLSPVISLGYHAHNNMQLAFANAQAISELITKRHLLIDATVFGMGRGAGNLNTELFVEYYNSTYKEKYKIGPLLEVIDEEINRIYSSHYWGYSLPHYLSACHNCHPNYATYLSRKNTLSIESINSILNQIPESKKDQYSSAYAEQLYREYQGKFCEDNELIKYFSSLNEKELLILAPGKSIEQYKMDIKTYQEKNHPVTIAVNFLPKDLDCDYIFFNNERRYRRYLKENILEHEIIITSNLMGIENVKVEKIINYDTILNNEEQIADNGTLMLINFLLTCGYKKIEIAGFDGYKPDEAMNYIEPEMAQGTQTDILLKRNDYISNQLRRLKNKVEIHFITPTIYMY